VFAHRCIVTILVALLSWSSARAAAAQETPGGTLPRSPMVMPRLDTPVQLDGVPDEPAWARVPPLPLTALYPTFESPLSEHSEIRVAYDATHLYASIIADDREPTRVMANTLYRDRWIGDDEFALILDTFNDGENAVMFLVTPAGVRVDNLISNNAEPGRGNFLNRDWNVPWEARARRTDRGWTAEFRVPFTSLRYRGSTRETRMRMKAFRYIPRKGENQMFPPTRPGDGPAPHFQPSLGREVVFLDLPQSQPLFVTPYAIASRAQQPGRRVRGGGDLKYALTSGLTLDVTVNTDFAQVESDDAQINLTRFSLFFPEKRPFFQERSGVFSLSTGGNSTVLYSRRVGLTADGTPRAIDGGVRLSGNAMGLELGALGVRTAPGGSQDAGEWIGVARARRSVGRSAFVGGIVTTRTTPGETQHTVALDGTRLVGPLGRLSLAVAHTLDSLHPRPGAANARVFAQLQRNVAGGTSYAIEYRGSGAHYSPALGFVQTAGFHEGLGSLSHVWRNAASHRIREYWSSVTATGRHRLVDGRPDELAVTTAVGASTRSNWFGTLRLSGSHEHVPAAFALGGSAMVPAGSYTALSTRLQGGTPFDRRFRSEFSVERGGLYGGERTTVAIEPIWSQSRHLELSASTSLTMLALPASARQTQTLLRARMRVAMTQQWFAEAFVQWNSTIETRSANLRIRFNPTEGHDLWLAVDATDQRLLVPRRAFVVKYSRMWTVPLGRPR